MKLKDGICHTCALKDKGGQTPYLFSAENKMDLGIVPAHLATKEHALGLSYVAVSQVKSLQGLLFECPFNYDHFQVKETNTFKDRELDVLVRNRQII
jgi:hypothetical protein